MFPFNISSLNSYMAEKVVCSDQIKVVFVTKRDFLRKVGLQYREATNAKVSGLFWYRSLTQQGEKHAAYGDITSMLVLNLHWKCSDSN
jgi:hypothetical protein